MPRNFHLVPENDFNFNSSNSSGIARWYEPYRDNIFQHFEIFASSRKNSRKNKKHENISYFLRSFFTISFFIPQLHGIDSLCRIFLPYFFTPLISPFSNFSTLPRNR